LAEDWPFVGITNWKQIKRTPRNWRGHHINLNVSTITVISALNRNFKRF